MASSSSPSQKPSSIPASRGLRLANAFIDGLVVSALTFVAILLPFVLGVALFLANEHSNEDVSPSLATSPVSALFTFLACWFVYYFALEGLWSRTLGKLLTRTVVVAADGGRPTWGAVALRTLCRLVPLEALTYLSSRDHHGLHDWASRTRVVRWRHPSEEIEV
jgi:uncharacterized RDD family membrane protein YckC